jgi:hypothetical protein
MGIDGVTLTFRKRETRPLQKDGSCYIVNEDMVEARKYRRIRVIE